MTCFYTFCAPNREAWAGAVLVFPNPGKPVRETVLSHSVLTFIFLNWFPFLLPSYCLQQGFLPSEIPMPSPNAISPSGLKSSSQFYSYEGSNPRRRSPQEPIGKILKDRFLDLADELHFKYIQVDLSLCLPSLLRLRFYKEILLPLD